MTRALMMFVGLLLFCGSAARAEDDDPIGDALDGLSGSKALELVNELAADGMKGRKTAFEGGSLVENWMLGKFSEFGLHPADSGGTYLEPFTYGASDNVAPISCKVSGKPLVYGADYYDLVYSGAGKVEAEVVFCGYGISRPDLGWDDYEGVDVKGRIVIAIRGAPAARASEFQAERFIGAKTATAADKGAVGFLLVEGEKASTGTIQERFHRPKLPALWLSGGVADGILGPKGGLLRKLKSARDEGEPGKSFATGVTVAMEVNARFRAQAKGHNALGDIKGRDPDLNHEVILVGAHMDHLGVSPTGAVFNGADDNASGTAVLVHLADVLTANRFRPKRTVVFCAFGAEEQGMVGSRALAARYPFRGQVVAVLNMDMVGQGEPAVSISGVGAYPAMHERLKGYLPGALAEKVRFKPRTGPHGDHWAFHERGVPAFFVATSGKHPNYHTPKDDAANVKAECLEAAARVVGTLVVRLATDPKPLADPAGVSSYLTREGPRFSIDHLIEKRDKSLGLARSAAHAGRMRDGLSALVINLSEEQDPAVAWRALEALEAAEGPVRYRVVRRAADLGRAFAEGRMALLPRLCCAKAAHETPAALSAYAKLGYRWIAPFTSGTPREHDRPAVAAIVAASQGLGLLLDAGGLPAAEHAAFRKALGGRPAVLLAAGPVEGADLGERTLPIVRLRGAAAWLDAIGACPGMAPPVVYTPHGGALVEALATWGRKQPAGWDLPGSAQRSAVRGALGGRLVEWLARAER